MSDTVTSFKNIDLYKDGWNLLKETWKPLLSIGAVWLIIEALAQSSLQYVEQQENSLLSLSVSLASLALSVILQSGFIAASFRIVREKTAEVSDLFAQKPVWVNYFLGLIAYQLLVALGMILLIVPGIYWALKYSQVLYLIVDKKVGVSEAFNMSGRMTQGMLLKLLGFGLISIPLNLIGLLALGVGVFVTLGITALAYVLLYEKLLQRIGTTQVTAAVKESSPANPTTPVDPPASVSSKT